jgi:hypoxanthine phosphoribosyltransferase
MNKRIISQHEMVGLVNKIAREISISGWKPDYIVGLTRGGLIPAVMLSHYLNVPMWTLNVRLRDGDGGESNLWMAEDALGLEPSIEITDEKDIGAVLDAASTLLEMPSLPTFKNILIVDDINDTGATFNWIMDDWKSGCFPDNPSWNEVWNFNVKFAVLVDNLSSQCNVNMDYIGIEVNKAEEDVWVDFPWEDWWTK